MCIPIFLLDILDGILSAKNNVTTNDKVYSKIMLRNAFIAGTLDVRIKSLFLLVIQQEVAIADCDKGKNKTGKISRERSKEKNSYSNYFAQTIETHI